MGTSFRQNGAGNIAKITPHVGATTPTTREPDFYLHCNRWVFEAIQRLVERKVPVDMLTLSEELERAGQLEEVGGSAYLTGLINQVPNHRQPCHTPRHDPGCQSDCCPCL